MLIDNGTAVLVCAGPSLDRLSPTAWKAIEQAGAIVSVNGSLVATTCLSNRVRFTYAAAMDVATGLGDHVPGFAKEWKETQSWRVSAYGTAAEAESYVKEVEWWGDSPDEGYVGGSTAMVVGNWLCNPWPNDSNSRRELEAIVVRTGKRIPLAWLQAPRLPGARYDPRAKRPRRGCRRSCEWLRRKPQAISPGLQRLAAILPRSA